MKTRKEIDFTQVDFITYALDEYLNDIPIYDIVNSYIRLYKEDDDVYIGSFENQDFIHSVRVNKNTNACFIDNERINPEEFILLFENQDTDSTTIIKKITGIDLDDYISDVTYKNGTIELLDVKGKTVLIGNSKRIINNR